MVLWIVAFIISVLLTLVMGAVFVFFSIVALNGYMSMRDAMPTFLAFICCAWPLMVGPTAFSTWLVFTIAKQKQPFWKIILFNMAIVTAFMTLLALAAYFT
jgi:small neutral amino acid transporter SnatA (MarC family)